MNNISIKCLKSETLESGSCHGEFLINSLKVGQGITIGNQLRRVLLTDLGGIAISAVRIAGVSHEFSTIPGVREDILEILLNLKGIVFIFPLLVLILLMGLELGVALIQAYVFITLTAIYLNDSEALH